MESSLRSSLIFAGPCSLTVLMHGACVWGLSAVAVACGIWTSVPLFCISVVFIIVLAEFLEVPCWVAAAESSGCSLGTFGAETLGRSASAGASCVYSRMPAESPEAEWAQPLAAACLHPQSHRNTSPWYLRSHPTNRVSRSQCSPWPLGGTDGSLPTGDCLVCQTSRSKASGETYVQCVTCSSPEAGSSLAWKGQGLDSRIEPETHWCGEGSARASRSSELDWVCGFVAWEPGS